MHHGSESPVLDPRFDRAESFDELFAANYAALSRLIYRVVGDTGAAEDLAAEAFWKLHRSPPAHNRHVTGWLFRTGLRLALDDLKKRKRRAHYESLTLPLGTAQSPEASLQQQEQQARVRGVLSALKPRQSSLLPLRGEGYTHSEMASLLELNQSSVGTLLARADRDFRKEYVSRHGER